MRKRIKRTILLFLLAAILLTGCWDRVEINDIAIVMLTALDAEPEGMFRECIEVALTGQLGGATGGGGGTAGDKVYYTSGAVGHNVIDAATQLQFSMSRKLFFAHRRVLLIGEELAKRSLADIFDIIARVPESRMSTLIVIAAGKACDMIGADTKLERFTGEAIREIVTMQSAIPSDVKDTSINLSTVGKDAVLPYLELRDIQDPALQSKEASIQGFAYFRDGRMAGTLQGRKATGLLWLMNTIDPYIEIIDVEGGYAALEIKNGTSKVRPHLRNGKLHFSVHANLEAQLLENVSPLNMNNPDDIEKLSQALTKQIESNIHAVLQDLQEHQSDTIGAGLKVYRKFPKLWLNQYQSNWHEHFAQLPFDIHVQSTIVRIGMITNNIVREEGTQ